MESQCVGIAQKLDQLNPDSAPHVCVSGFRYCSPPRRDDQEIQGSREDHSFSQYPQHSCCTSGSSFCDAYRWLNNQDNSDYQDKISVIDQWWDRTDYTELWAMLIKRKFDEMKKEHGLKDEDIQMIYSVHSLPESYCLEKGDKYNMEIQGSVN